MKIIIIENLLDLINIVENLEIGKCNILIIDKDDVIDKMLSSINCNKLKVIKLSKCSRYDIDIAIAKKEKLLCVIDLSNGLKNLSNYALENLGKIIIPKNLLNISMNILKFLKLISLS